ncbi:hypothetical protein EJD97_019231 [Solanum chilense]|uniref:Uncharacterized protein n=1 Tax=Solanum chilense TaxID=4083 RepID=A0A6N2AZH0_SOLCI|nr:hypothetical protein EJD97_019231 [Solanum chilense]
MANEESEKKKNTSSGEAKQPLKTAKKKALGWMEWLRGWFYLVYEMLFQRILASHLHNPMPLPPINDVTCIVTGSTSGIGREIARQLAEAGAHVVMAVRSTNRAQELIRKWQEEWSGKGLPLNIEVMELDLLSLDSVARFAEAWNARMAPVHVLINNAGIFSIGVIASMHYVGFVDPEDMNVVSGKRKYTSVVGYGGSKLAQIMFSSILHKRLPAESGISVVCNTPGIVLTNVARDLPQFLQVGYRLIPYFIFNAEEGSRSTLFAATDPQIFEYCEMLKADDWPVCAYISHDCRPTNASEEAHNIETSYKVWEKTLELVGLPSDAVERLIEGEEIKCRYGNSQE